MLATRSLRLFRAAVAANRAAAQSRHRVGVLLRCAPVLFAGRVGRLGLWSLATTGGGGGMMGRLGVPRAALKSGRPAGIDTYVIQAFFTRSAPRHLIRAQVRGSKV